MKSLAIASLLVMSGAAFAGAGSMSPHGGPAHVVIQGLSVQVALFDKSTVSNKATNDNAKATQNVSSNSGNVTVNKQLQVTALQGSSLTNKAKNDHAEATQNVSSNLGLVDINGTSVQITAARSSYITNEATNGYAKAVQNIASNNGCDTCKPSYSHSPR